MTTKQTTLTTPIINLARELAANANRPMSPDQIKGKFQLEFPFTVRRVVAGDPAYCNHDTTGKASELITFYRISPTGGYIYAEYCNCKNWAGAEGGLSIEPDSERFVLV